MRKAVIERTTKETQISITLSLDEQFADIDTGIGFFDHMLTAFAVHGGFGLSVRAKGDLYVDCHHTIEDTGIVLGKPLTMLSAIRAASQGSVRFMFLWTRLSASARLISAADRSWFLTLHFPKNASAAMTAA